MQHIKVVDIPPNLQLLYQTRQMEAQVNALRKAYDEGETRYANAAEYLIRGKQHPR